MLYLQTISTRNLEEYMEKLVAARTPIDLPEPNLFIGRYNKDFDWLHDIFD